LECVLIKLLVMLLAKEFCNGIYIASYLVISKNRQQCIFIDDFVHKVKILTSALEFRIFFSNGFRV
jgi:hypothetical protein